MATDEAYRDLHRKQTREYKRRVLSDPCRRRQIQDRSRELYATSPERRATRAAYDKKRYITRTEDQVELGRLRQRKQYHAKKSCPNFRAAERARGAQWAKDNKARCNAKTAIRRAARLRATPPWLTESMRAECLAIYAEAKRLTSETGVPHEVDHVVPLHGINVCGLHVPWNLQILTEQENRAKHNSVREDW